jgi:hypothetical protein
MKYIISVIVSIFILLGYAFIGAVVFGWSHGGGIFPQLLLWSTIILVWKYITKNWENLVTRIKTPHLMDKLIPSIDDTSFYEIAMRECEGTEPKNTALWSKAFSLSEGDEGKAKAKYIELRVNGMRDEERVRIKEEKDRVKNEREKYRKRLNENLKFECPHCNNPREYFTRRMILTVIESNDDKLFFTTCPDCRKEYDIRTVVDVDSIKAEMR